MPKAFPLEFGRDVAAVARRREAPLSRIAKDFGISESCLHRWVKRAEIEDGVREGITQAEAAEMRELRKRNRLLEQENEVSGDGDLRRSRPEPKMIYPLVRDLAADEIPVVVTCPGAELLAQAFYKWDGTAPGERGPRGEDRISSLM